ncbi:MAG: low molecular weight phosphotyrosine protein phosphatase [Lachnospiraceae bacterium]|nr:low molecular weight phosphotyrosine protein phosphatase [Lachnospiraceae bacterium]
MTKVLFICHGNICRSPMAEFIFKDLVARQGLADQFEIASAATSREEIGNPVYPPARRKLAEHGISCAAKRARQVTAADYAKYDYLLVMDRQNLRNLRRIISADPEKKIRLLREFSGQSGEIADPWYTDDFDTAYRQIEEGCRGLLEHILRFGSDGN